MRLAAIFWIQSLEQNNDDRQILSISTSRSSASATSSRRTVNPFDYRHSPQFTGAMV